MGGDLAFERDVCSSLALRYRTNRMPAPNLPDLVNARVIIATIPATP